MKKNAFVSWRTLIPNLWNVQIRRLKENCLTQNSSMHMWNLHASMLEPTHQEGEVIGQIKGMHWLVLEYCIFWIVEFLLVKLIWLCILWMWVMFLNSLLNRYIIYHRTYKLSCEMFIYVRVNKDADHMYIARSCHTHNHETSQTLFQHYPENRNVDGKELSSIENMMNLKVKVHVMCEELRTTTGKAITHKDVHNLRAKFNKERKGLLSDEANLLQELKNISHSDVGRLDKYLLMRMEKFLLCICKHHMQKVFKKFPELCFLDGTYTTRYYWMPLYTIMIEDGNGVSIPVVHFWVADETTITREKDFQCFTKHNEVDKVRLFIIDKDFHWSRNLHFACFKENCEVMLVRSFANLKLILSRHRKELCGAPKSAES